MAKYLITFIALFSGICKAQIGGNYTFAFLNLQPSARIASLGGHNISAADADVNMGYQNPALLNAAMNNQVSYNIVNYFTDIQYGYTAYAHHVKKVGTFAAGMQYINYGKFDGRDEAGLQTGIFTASERCFHISYAYAYSKQVSFGINAKYVTSNLGGYKATGLMADLGANYKSKDSLFDAAVVFKNVGAQLTTYTANNTEPIPYEFMAGLSYKPKHAPIRFSMTGNHLNTMQTTFLNPNKPKKYSLETGEEIPDKISGAYKVFSHITFATEFLLGKNVQLRFGYNPRRAREMALEGVRSATGFSWGFGFRVKRFLFSYGSAQYFMGQSTNLFSFAVNLDKLKLPIKKKG
jgi:hypothetical protein